MSLIKKLTSYFTKGELILWTSSVILIILSFLMFDRENYLTLTATILGVTAILFGAKGNPVSQVLMVIFCLIYTYISYTFSYYGEMITYLGMTLPMAIISFVFWFSNPYKGNRAQVTVSKITKKDLPLLIISTILVTVVFYFILKHFNTANLAPSTFSVTTSFLAVFLTAKRSPYFSLAYAANDVVLIVLWSLACIEDITYISVVACFIAFFAHDIYSFISWRRMEKHQRLGL